jgi:hypothetical protein
MMESAFHDPLKRLRLETAWLQKEFIQAVNSGGGRHTQLTCEMAVIRLHDAWARFCRELIILSAFGHTVTLSGVQLNPSSAAIRSRSLVIPVLLSTYHRKGRVFEPKWADAGECVDAARRLSIMNLSTVAAALGAVNSPANDIRCVRNFYAHRRKGAAMNAGATNLFSNPLRPVVFELAGYTHGGDRVIESWITGLIDVGTAAVQ